MTGVEGPHVDAGARRPWARGATRGREPDYLPRGGAVLAAEPLGQLDGLPGGALRALAVDVDPELLAAGC
jgi:hypothetical protein